MDNNFLGIDTNEFESAPLITTLQEVAPMEDPTGEGQPTRQTSNIKIDPFEAGMNAALHQYHSQPQPSFSVSSYDPATKERYKSDPSIYNDFFDPAADNERIAYENWDKWDAISAGLGQMKDSFTSAFAESAYTWPRVAKALFTLDSSYLSPSQEEMDKMAVDQEKSRLENPIFYASGTEDDFLTKGFLAETISNLGYTFGTLAEVGTEFVLGSIAAGALASTGAGAGAGAAVEAGVLARTGAKLNSLWGNMSKFFVGSSLDDATKAATLTESGLKTGAAFEVGKETKDALRTLNAQTNAGLNGVRQGVNIWDNALKVASNVPFVGQLADAARLAKAARTAELTGNELVKIGAGGLRRSFAEWQMAAGEASIEAGANNAELIRHLSDEYAKDHGGQTPIGEELQNIKNLALKSSTADFATNVAILGITNKIQWGNIIGKFNMDSAALTRIRTAIGSDIAADLGIIGVRNATKTKLYKTGLLGTLGLAPKIYGEFGAKQATWEVGKSLLKGVTRIEASEGLQENLQEGTNVFLIDYYSDIYKKNVSDWGKNFNDAVNSQLTKQGAKTFMMGALTGIFTRPVITTTLYIGEKGGLNPNAVKHRESIRQSIETLNKFYDQPSETILKEAVKQIKLQNMYNDGMVEGLLTKDKYQYFNNKDSALIQTILHAKRTGTTSYLNEFIKGYGENMNNEEFKQAFGYSPEEMGYSSPKDVLADIASSASEFSKIYDKYQTKFGLLLGLEDLINDKDSRQKFSIKRAALMDAITTVAFIESKAKQSIKRASNILQNVNKYPSIGNSLGSSFNTITSPEKIDDELLILENEIKTLSEGEQTEATKKIIENKNKELSALGLIKLVMYELKTIEDPTNPGKTINVYDTRVLNTVEGALPLVAKYMGQYLDIKNKQSGITNPIVDDELNDAIRDIYDYMSLGQDHAEYIQSVNMLNNPEKFSKYYENLMDARASAHARLLYDDYQQMAEISEVAKKWKEENKKLFDELLDFSKRPSGSFKNFIKLQDIRNKLDQAKDQLTAETSEIQEQKQEEVAVEKQKEQKQEQVANTSKLPKPVAVLYEQGIDDPDKLAEADEYMGMRFNLDEIRSNFPFESVDIGQRKIYRYYVNESGQKIAAPSPIIIPLAFDLYGTGDEIPLDTYETVFGYLTLFEQSKYDAYSSTQESTAKETDKKTEEIDVEKNKLANHIGNEVVINGVRGELQVVNDNYVIKTSTGIAIVGPVTENASFDDFADVTPAYESLPAEEKEIIKPNTNAVIDTQESGTVTMSIDMNLETVEINGVSWNIEKDDSGLAIGLTRKKTVKKGKSEKVFIERLSGNNPKNQDYIKRINSFLLLTAKPLNDNMDDLVEESEVLDEAIALVENMVEKESGQRKKSDEILAQYQLNKLINVNITPEITEIRTKFDNPLTKENLTQDELIQLFVWADDLVNGIKSQWSVYLTNPVVNGFLSQLNKEYINPISEIIDTNARKRKPAKSATKRSPSQKKRAEKLVEAVEPREVKRGTKPVPAEVGTKKGRKRTVKQAVDSIESKAQRKKAKTAKVEPVAAPTEKKQKLPINTGSKIIKNLASEKVQSIKNAIEEATTIPVSAEAKADIEAKKAELEAAIEKQKEDLKKITIGTPVGGIGGLKVGGRVMSGYNAEIIDEYDPDFDPNIAENDGDGYSIVTRINDYGESKDGKLIKRPKIFVTTFNTKAEADAFLEKKKAKNKEFESRLGTGKIIDRLKAELATLAKSSLPSTIDINPFSALNSKTSCEI